VAAEHEGRDVLHRDLELLGDKGAEAGRVEDARHPDHALVREADFFHASCTMASSGFVTRMRMAFFERATTCSTTPPTISAFLNRRSSRVIPACARDRR